MKLWQIRESLRLSLAQCELHTLPVVRIATLLDPSTKAMPGFSEPVKQHAWQELKETLQANRAVPLDVVHAMPSEVPEAAVAAAAVPEMTLLEQLKASAAEVSGETSVPILPSVPDLDAELTRYMAADGVPFDRYQSAMEWWSLNQHLFPNIARLALFYLPIPATSAASEVVFSIMQVVLSKAENRKLPEHTGVEVFLRANLKFYLPESEQVRREVQDLIKNPALCKA